MSSTLPFVSVIMPIRNEADFIERSLGAVLGQDYPADRMEVLVADGMSDDGTQAIILSLAREISVCVKLIDNTQLIVPTGFNVALRKARGEIIVRVDGHTIIAPDYVRKCVELLLEEKTDNVGGRMSAVGSTLLSNTIAAATSSPFGVGGARFHYSNQEEYVDTVYMGAWWRTTFDRIGQFDEEFVRNQDDEFNYRLRASGGRILLSPDIKSTYYGRSSLRRLWRQYFQYGMYKVRVLQKHPRQMQWRQFVPFALVTSLAGSLAISVYVKRLRALFALVAGVYGLANLVASILTARKTGWASLRYLPAVYAVLHFSYGLGFAVGLVKFRGRWRDNDVQQH